MIAFVRCKTPKTAIRVDNSSTVLLNQTDNTKLFCLIDDFCIRFKPIYLQNLKESGQIINPTKACNNFMLQTAQTFSLKSIRQTRQGSVMMIVLVVVCENSTI